LALESDEDFLDGEMPEASEGREKILSIVYTTKHPGWYDGLLQGLAHQTSRDFELICVDENAEVRGDKIKRFAEELGVPLRMVLPGKPRSKKNTFKLFSAYNTGLLASRGEVITMLNDYAWLPPDFVNLTLSFYWGTREAGLKRTKPLKKSLLGYADRFYDVPPERMDKQALTDYSSLSVFSPALGERGEGGGSPRAEGWVERLQLSPLDCPSRGYKPHWGWDGAGMTAPYSAYLELGGFDENMDAGDDNQMENIRDRLMLKGWDVWIAPEPAAVQQAFHYEWEPDTIWKRFGDNSNAQRWPATLKLIKDGKYPLLSEANEFQLGTGAKHRLPRPVAAHFEKWSWTKADLSAPLVKILSPAEGGTSGDPTLLHFVVENAQLREEAFAAALWIDGKKAVTGYETTGHLAELGAGRHTVKVQLIDLGKHSVVSTDTVHFTVDTAAANRHDEL